MPQSFSQSQVNSPQKNVSGMIVCSSSARILHMNGPARALMALFNTAHDLWPQVTPESMPSIFTELCDNVQAQLQHRIEAKDLAQFEIRRICHMVTPPLLLTGFGVQNSTNREVRVILTLTPLPSNPCGTMDSRYFHPSTDGHAPVNSAVL
jgi:hypothetical protein